MNHQQKGLLALLESAVLNKTVALPEKFDLDSIMNLVFEHHLAPVVYYGAVICGFDKSSETMKTLFQRAFPLVLLDEQQRAALDELFSAFDSEKISYMPLKGTVLKELYPKPEMRTMSDADILIRVEQYDVIRETMTRLGYCEKLESDHELVWVKDNVCIELHKRLIPSYNKDYYVYFGDGWKFAEQKENFAYTMSSDMCFIYLFVHFAKHYRDGGIGIKHLLDLWIYMEKKTFDFQYIKEELKKLHLDEFFENVTATIATWFKNGEETEVTKLITEVIFGSGAYGDKEAAKASNVLRESKDAGSVKKAKCLRTIKVIFLPYKAMCDRYEVLKKAPILLPVMWVARFFDVLLFRRKEAILYFKSQKQITNEKIKLQEARLKIVGLDYNFGVEEK